MTVKEALTAAETTDNFILGVQTAATGQETPDLYTVVQEHVTEHSGAINASTTDTAYIRTGTVTTKTGAQRQITINGERFAGDDFQDFALSNKMLFATGQDAVVKYVYFSLRTGKGEQGEAVLIVNNDVSNAANNPAGFSAQLNIQRRQQPRGLLGSAECRGQADRVHLFRGIRRTRHEHPQRGV